MCVDRYASIYSVRISIYSSRVCEARTEYYGDIAEHKIASLPIPTFAVPAKRYKGEPRQIPLYVHAREPPIVVAQGGPPVEDLHMLDTRRPGLL